VCVCLLVTFVSSVETAEPIGMPFGRLTWVGPEKHVLDGGSDPQGKPGKGQLLGLLFDRVDLIKPVSNVRPSVHKKLRRGEPYGATFLGSPLY